MKMPTAVVRHRVPWKSGDQVSYPLGEGSPSPEEPFPSASAPNGRSPAPTRAPPGSRDEGMVAVMAAAASLSLSAPSSVSTEGTSQRTFPILGPTRQDTELYFRRRRSARHRMKTASRPLVTRSADRVVPVDFSPARLSYTTLTPSLSANSPTITRASSTSTAAATTTNNNHHPHLKGFRYVEIDPYGSHNNGDVFLEPDSQTVTTSLPLFDHASGSAHNKGSKPVSTFPRSGSSPGVARTSLPHFDRSASYHAGFGGSGTVKNGVGKKHEIPIKFLSESGQIRTSELTHRVNKTGNDSHKQAHPQKTMQPSKYGFHRRSKSPTFKRLVEVAEKLQHVNVSESNGDLDKCNMHQTQSSSSARLPAVAGAGTGDGGGRGEGAGGGGGGEEEEADVSDEEATHVHPRDFLAYYSVHRQSAKEATKPSKPRQSTSHSSSPATRHSRHTSSKKLSIQTNSNYTHDVATSTADSDVHPNGWGEWEVDGRSAAENGVVDPLRLTLPLGMGPSDSHTELHLFLPRLADTPSEESGSGVVSKASPERYRSQLTHNPRASNHLQQRGKAVVTASHPHTSSRPPQHPNSTPQVVTAGERSSRPPSRRFSSPVRILRRDRTPKRRGGAASASEMCESYEPYIRGEHLKEKLEDFPTLISLDND